MLSSDLLRPAIRWAWHRAGVPSGIDVCRVLESGLAPTINTGIAHREPGIGQVGAGVVNAPIACFEQAVRALADVTRSS